MSAGNIGISGEPVKHLVVTEFLFVPYLLDESCDFVPSASKLCVAEVLLLPPHDIWCGWSLVPHNLNNLRQSELVRRVRWDTIHASHKHLRLTRK